MWDIDFGGSSGLFACLVGLGMGYDEIVLAGIPMDDSGHFYDPPTTEHKYFENLLPNWRYARDEWFEGKVRSLSGYTKNLL